MSKDYRKLAGSRAYRNEYAALSSRRHGYFRLWPVADIRDERQDVRFLG